MYSFIVAYSKGGESWKRRLNIPMAGAYNLEDLPRTDYLGDLPISLPLFLSFFLSSFLSLSRTVSISYMISVWLCGIISHVAFMFALLSYIVLHQNCLQWLFQNTLRHVIATSLLKFFCMRTIHYILPSASSSWRKFWDNHKNTRDGVGRSIFCARESNCCSPISATPFTPTPFLRSK